MRQHATPLLLPPGGKVISQLVPLSLGSHEMSEAAIQALVQAHPACLPIGEIDPLFTGPVPICTELATPAGLIDNFMVTASGLPVLVECKLWRNPEGRREVVGQILDYAKELARWSSSDLQRETSRRLGRNGNAILELVRDVGHDVDEIGFNDALTANLRRGRFLLLIVGDGIREGVEAIAEYLQAHAGLHFTFGLVEMPVYATPDGGRLVAPRVLARTTLIPRQVVAVPEGFVVSDGGPSTGDPDEADDPGTVRRIGFMREVTAPPFPLDPDQPSPRVSPKGWLSLYLPAPASSCWVSVLFKEDGCRIGIRLTSNANTVGEAAIALVVARWPDLLTELGKTATLRQMSPGRFVVEEFITTDVGDLSRRHEAVEWVRTRLRDYVAIFRPRIRDAVAELSE